MRPPVQLFRDGESGLAQAADSALDDLFERIALRGIEPIFGRRFNLFGELVDALLCRKEGWVLEQMRVICKSPVWARRVVSMSVYVE